jgi:RimJ/RimL family protein N-acetyltransferase
MPGPPYLRGEKVDLHVIEESDLEFLYGVVNDPRVWPSLQQSEPLTMADEREFYEGVVNADGETHLLICHDRTPVGIVGLNGVDPNWGVAELGYYVEPDSQGHGYATEAVDLLVDYAFDQRRLAKLEADALASNEGSQAVLEKNGFVEEGRFRGHAHVDGERVDVLRYGLLAEER